LTAGKALEHLRLTQELDRLRSQVDHMRTLDSFFGLSAVMKEISHLIQREAFCVSPIVILGESGTGKELIARAIHEHSRRRNGPFIAVDLDTIPGDCIEAELFGGNGNGGRDRGAFQLAHDGILLLDNIHCTPLATQERLLRWLNGGDDTGKEAKVRIIVTTEIDLKEAVDRGILLPELYYRLNAVQIHLPPLRNRIEDIIPLAYHFLRKYTALTELEVTGLHVEVQERLRTYGWPGNIRELENVIAQACMQQVRGELMLEALPAYLKVSADAMDREPVLTVQELECEHIRTVLAAVRGNKARAARLLGIDRRTLYRKMERYDLSGE
ncbi:sigma-54-dependent Fis family transcriptional regulator, partial [bacterium]|nr:sigma-54-dependent Fis family transcriptional regulator [candidate division CSSED10-310 bacterium]